ncbi:hypothetical protein QYE76_052031 [Lolium multiflorum]|uniref:Uncharacterized protein n=1 Tax=Lolium multiflorum TaxID=4521 RepID=A0AAD8SSY2_LOLMU|nr:hypothetical protein QYE76_052020 [Lolium multiflorum]KAK1663867.1 hypothetical protein QYE76_052026 [Lolium multiflorum]KAK1663872.1 hypothetical protein QYE76_052031 [Lolium multiflorum]
MITEMAAASTSSNLHSLSFLLLLLVALSEATMLNITNRCSYTVWPAALPIGGGVQLNPGKTWALNVSGLTSRGRLWARTGCSFDSRGNGSCQTGDCGGVLACKGHGRPPNTMAEFIIGQFNSTDFFDMSFVDGFNVPMDFLPVPAQGRTGCSKGPSCAANVTSQCPSELKAPGGCNNACTVFKQDRYCCTGNAAYNCVPTKYSMFFNQMCPDVYVDSMDTDWNKTFTCPLGTNYQIVFCPQINLTTSPGTGSSSSKGRIGLILDLIDKNSDDMQAHEQDAIQMMKLAMWCLQIDCKRRPKMSEVVMVLEGTMYAESNIDHNFVATNQATFGIPGSVTSSVPPLASHVSGPR